MSKLIQSLITFAVGLPLYGGMAVMAAYVPPGDQVPPRTRGGTAGRRTTCDVNGVTPVAPINYLGKTNQSHPTFYWITRGFRPTTIVPLEFSLMEYQPETEKLVVLGQQKLTSQTPIDRFELPRSWQGLEVGKVYAWQVVALCGNPSANPYLRAAIQRVNPIVNSAAKKPEQQIQQLANQGIWYDALGLAFQLGKSSIGMNLIQDLALAESKREPMEMETEYRHSYLLKTITP